MKKDDIKSLLKRPVFLLSPLQRHLEHAIQSIPSDR